MKKLLLPLLAMAPSICISQTIKERKTDKFDGIKTISTSEERLIVSFSKEPIFTQGYLFKDDKTNDQLFSLYFNFKAGAVGSFVPDESKIVLLLSSGAPLELIYKGKYKLYSSGQTVYFTTNLDTVQLRALSLSKVTDIRVSGVADFQIKEKQQLLIGNICSLLLQESIK